MMKMEYIIKIISIYVRDIKNNLFITHYHNIIQYALDLLII